MRQHERQFTWCRSVVMHYRSSYSRYSHFGSAVDGCDITKDSRMLSNHVFTLCLTFHSYITHNTHFQRNSCDDRLALSSVLFRIFRHIFKIAFYPASPKRHRKTEKKHCVVVRMYFSETLETCGNMKGNLHSVEAYHALSFIK